MGKNRKELRINRLQTARNVVLIAGSSLLLCACGSQPPIDPNAHTASIIVAQAQAEAIRIKAESEAKEAAKLNNAVVAYAPPLAALTITGILGSLAWSFVKGTKAYYPDKSGNTPLLYDKNRGVIYDPASGDYLVLESPERISSEQVRITRVKSNAAIGISKNQHVDIHEPKNPEPLQLPPPQMLQLPPVASEIEVLVTNDDGSSLSSKGEKIQPRFDTV